MNYKDITAQTAKEIAEKTGPITHEERLFRAIFNVAERKYRKLSMVNFGFHAEKGFYSLEDENEKSWDCVIFSAEQERELSVLLESKGFKVTGCNGNFTIHW